MPENYFTMFLKLLAANVNWRYLCGVLENVWSCLIDNGCKYRYSLEKAIVKHIYFRYIESNCYTGFVEQKGKEILANELNYTASQLFIWNVYTDMDIKLKRIHIPNKSVRRASTNACANKRLGKPIYAYD